MLKIKNLTVSAGGKTILDKFDLEVPKNEVHVIMGPNGVGKSTVCKAIMGDADYKKEKGTIKFKNEDITNAKTDVIARKGIFYLAQNPTEVPGVTNAEMLRTALAQRGVKTSIFEFNKEMNEACEKMHVDKSFIHRNINERMSGGEKKKNELLGLYMLKPELILLDEVDSGLDIDSLEHLSSALNEYKKMHSCSIIIITHHTNILKYIHPDKVHLLEAGHIELEGDTHLAEIIEENGFKGAFNIKESDARE